MTDSYEMKVLFGTAHPRLGQRICHHLGVEPVDIDVRRFKDGEIFVQIAENIRGKDVFIVQPTCPPVNKNLMELLILMDAAKRASAKRITAVLPYYGYARQDRKDRPRVPITARLVADLVTTAGADRVLTIDLHAGQIQGFFNIPMDHLHATPVFIDYLRNRTFEDELIVVSPDAGGVERAKFLARCLQAPLAVADKRRKGHNEADSIRIIGDVANRSALILDDIIDTAGTLMKAVDALKDAGASHVMCCASHGILSDPALERIENNKNLDEVIITDTICHGDAIAGGSKIKILSIGHLLAKAIQCIHSETSVSSLFVINK